VCARIRGVRVDRLSVTHPGDDDNLWYIRQSTDGPEVKIESRPDGQAPFLIEGDEADQRLEIATADEAVIVIQKWLHGSN
jgi:hypothetical protein